MNLISSVSSLDARRSRQRNSSSGVSGHGRTNHRSTLYRVVPASNRRGGGGRRRSRVSRRHSADRGSPEEINFLFSAALSGRNGNNGITGFSKRYPGLGEINHAFVRVAAAMFQRICTPFDYLYRTGRHFVTEPKEITRLVNAFSMFK